MLAQFQSLYPQGSLITELLQIYHGKYIVRASVQIEGVIRATGMACAETLEEAEDRARNRALSVVGITTTPQQSVTVSIEPVTQLQPNPTLAVTSGLNDSALPSVNSFPQTQATAFTPQSNANSKDISQDAVISNHLADSQDLSQDAVIHLQEPQLDVPEELGMSFHQLEPLQSISSSNVTPFTPRSYKEQDNAETRTATAKKKKKSEPVDLSDVIAKTDVEIERLGWSKDQGREYLKKTYGKIGRTLLTEEELLDFLRYLESQPTPPDPLAGF